MTRDLAFSRLDRALQYRRPLSTRKLAVFNSCQNANNEILE